MLSIADKRDIVLFAREMDWHIIDDRDCLAPVIAFVDAGYSVHDFEDSYMGSVSDMAEFAREYADSLGLLECTVEWPFNHIDWKSAGNQLKTDFVTIDNGFGGIYVYRVD